MNIFLLFVKADAAVAKDLAGIKDEYKWFVEI